MLIPAAFLLSLVLSIPKGLVNPRDFDSSFIFLAASAALGIVYQGMAVSLVRDVQDGRQASSVGELLRSVGPVLGPLLVAGLLFGIGLSIGLFLLVVPACFLASIWAVTAPAIVVEKKGVVAAFGRSRELVRGFGWPVFGIVLVTALIEIAAGLVRLGIVEAIAGGPFLHAGGPILRIVLDTLVSALVGPIGGLVAAVLYYRLLDLKGHRTVSAGGPD